MTEIQSPDYIAHTEMASNARAAIDAARVELSRSRSTPLAILKDEFRGTVTKRTIAAQAQLDEAVAHERVIRDMDSLSLIPQPFGTFRIEGLLTRNIVTGFHDGNIRDVSIRTNRVRTMPEDGSAGTFTLQTIATIDGVPAPQKFVERAMDLYVAPLKARNRLSEQIRKSGAPHR